VECRWFFQQEKTYRVYSGDKYLLLETQEEDRNRCDRRAKVESDFGNTMAYTL